MASRRADVERVKREEEERRKQEAKIFLTDQDTYHLAAARQLIIHKSFGWDKLVGDLERFVPHSARIVTIKVNGIARSENGVTASLELSALGRSPADLTEMMAAFEKSDGLFEVGDANQGELTDTGETPFAIDLQYHQRGGGDQ
jgi:Tfp pilus assembly protein PilN